MSARKDVEQTEGAKTTKEFAREWTIEDTFDISRKSLQKHRWAKTGPPYHKIHGRIYYEVAAVRRWLMDGKVETQS